MVRDIIEAGQNKGLERERGQKKSFEGDGEIEKGVIRMSVQGVE